MTDRPRIAWRPVDVVALVLAIALGLAMVLVMAAVIVNVSSHKNPTPTLGENTAQVLIAVIGGVVGVLGSYIGYRSNNRDDK